MANQPHPSKRAVTYRLDGDLVDRVKAVAAERGETVLALVTRALERELGRGQKGSPDDLADRCRQEQRWGPMGLIT